MALVSASFERVCPILRYLESKLSWSQFIIFKKHILPGGDLNPHMDGQLLIGEQVHSRLVELAKRQGWVVALSQGGEGAIWFNLASTPYFLAPHGES